MKKKPTARVDTEIRFAQGGDRLRGARACLLQKSALNAAFLWQFGANAPEKPSVRADLTLFLLFRQKVLKTLLTSGDELVIISLDVNIISHFRNIVNIHFGFS